MILNIEIADDKFNSIVATAAVGRFQRAEVDSMAEAVKQFGSAEAFLQDFIICSLWLPHAASEANTTAQLLGERRRLELLCDCPSKTMAESAKTALVALDAQIAALPSSSEMAAPQPSKTDKLAQ